MTGNAMMAEMVGALTMSDISRTPDVIRSLKARQGEIEDFTRRHLTPDPGGRLYAFGCGDGLCAIETIESDRFVGRTAFDFLVYDTPRLTPADRVLAISMSGNVDRGFEGAKATLERGVPLAVLTQLDGGQLATTGAPVLSLQIPVIKPFLCGTASYTATVYTLKQVVALLDGEEFSLPDETIALLAERSCIALAPLQRHFKGARFLSAGVNIATAAHAAEKLVELTRVPSWSADIEEFAHSQFWAADPDELVVYYAAHPHVAALASHSAAVMGEMGFRTLAIETEDCPVPGAQIRITVPKVDERLSPIVFAIPTQILAWHLSLASGVDPDVRHHIKGDQVRFTTSRRLTRQALVGTGR